MVDSTNTMTRPENKTRLQSPGLVSDKGATTITDTVVAKIAAIAAREIPGVHGMVAGGVGARVAGLAQRVMGSDTRGRGVSVEVGKRETAVDLALEVDYGVNIAQLGDAVRSNIIERVQGMTGLVVKEVNIEVSDLFFPEDEAARQRPSRVE